MPRLLAVLVAALLTSPCLAQKPKTPPKARTLTAAQVMDRGAAALGPKAAWDKIQSTVMTGSIEVKGQNVKGKIVVKAKRPGKFIVRQDLTGYGVTLQGYDGVVGWSKDPVQGLRTLTGAELAATKRAAIMDAHLQWRKLYRKWELIGTKKVNGRDAHVVRLSPALGRFTLEYHDTKTHQLVRTDLVTETAQGPLPIEVYPSDYRKVDGVLVPFVVRQRMLHSEGPVEVLMRIQSVRNNVAIKDAEFAKPRN